MMAGLVRPTISCGSSIRRVRSLDTSPAIVALDGVDGGFLFVFLLDLLFVVGFNQGQNLVVRRVRLAHQRACSGR